MVETILPPVGTGYTTYNREAGGADQYGTAKTIAGLVRLGRSWALLHKDAPFSVGDISRKGGGPFPPHKSHQTGRDVDFRPLRRDKQNLPCNWRDAVYSRVYTREIIKLMHQLLKPEAIFFNDPELVREGLCQPLTGHDNHLHVRFKV